jgi:hypothetical protein
VTRALCLLVFAVVLAACTGLPSPEASAAPGPVDAARNDSFALEIATPRDHYASTEAIAIDTTITYLGPRDQIVASSEFPALVTFGLEQIGGDLDMPGGSSDTMCETLAVTAREPLAVRFGKSGAYSDSDPMAGFWDAYFTDPQLHLPPGRWRVSASLRAWTTPDCSGRLESLDAAVTFVVE